MPEHPDTRVYGFRNDERVTAGFSEALAMAVDQEAQYEPNDIVAVQPQYSDERTATSDTPLRINGAVVQFGSDDADAAFVEQKATEPRDTYIALADIDEDTSALEADGITHVRLYNIMYDVTHAAPRAGGRISRCLAEYTLESWVAGAERRTELPPDHNNRTDSRQVTRDPDREPCAVCGSKWTDRRYTFRPRSIEVKCAVCGQVHQRESP